MPTPTADWTPTPLLPVAWGEVFDKWTILVIKSEKLTDPAALANVSREREAIEAVIGDRLRFPDTLDALIRQLMQLNASLWEIEDGKRECERLRRFDSRFIELARQVYFKNDERARIKRAINALLGSELVEEKSYQQY